MTDQNQTENPDMGVVQNMDQLAFLVGDWFTTNRKELHHFLEVPDGEEITVQLEVDGPTEQLILTGDALKGFKAGLIVASNLFDKLPFATTAMAVAQAQPNEPVAMEVNESGRLQLVVSNDQPDGPNATTVASQAELDAAIAAKGDAASPQ